MILNKQVICQKCYYKEKFTRNNQSKLLINRYFIKLLKI